jgi:hypothetical protein
MIQSHERSIKQISAGLTISKMTLTNQSHFPQFFLGSSGIIFSSLFIRNRIYTFQNLYVSGWGGGGSLYKGQPNGAITGDYFVDAGKPESARPW